MTVPRFLGPAAQGPDGLWRALVEVNGGPAVQIVSEPMGTSAGWCMTEAERAVLSDLMRTKAR